MRDMKHIRIMSSIVDTVVRMVGLYVLSTLARRASQIYRSYICIAGCCFLVWERHTDTPALSMTLGTPPHPLHLKLVSKLGTR